MKTFALALGGGGARGFAHIAALEALDEMGVRPSAIAGSSMGALLGAGYAAGMTAKEIRRFVVRLSQDPGGILRRLVATRSGTLGDLFDLGFATAMLIDAKKLCREFLPDDVPDDFGELQIPLTVVATDLHRRQELVFSSGALRQALAASIAAPMAMRPVKVNGRVLVDGSVTNPLPFDHLGGRADIIVALDTVGEPTVERADIPNPWECLFATMLVMGSTIIAEKLKHTAPDLILRPQANAFRVADFSRASAILRAAEPLKAELKEKLGALLAS
jgi:NTE family protein